METPIARQCNALACLLRPLALAVAMMGSAELQSYLVFAAAVHAGSTSPAPAAAFIAFLSDPGAREHWKAGGLESMGGGS